MKRSEINKYMEDALNFIEKEHKFHLPPFAKWSYKEWQNKGSECKDIVTQQLGWDITDYGEGKFEKRGMILFTIRNGVLEDLKKGIGKVYAEKIMIIKRRTDFSY